MQFTSSLEVIVAGDTSDLSHVVLLLPSGEALDAAGSISGTRSRGGQVAIATPFQIQTAVVAASQGPVVRDHRGGPQQAPAAAMFTNVRLYSNPMTFHGGVENVFNFTVVYDCQLPSFPCSQTPWYMPISWQVTYPSGVIDKSTNHPPDTWNPGNFRLCTAAPGAAPGIPINQNSGCIFFSLWTNQSGSGPLFDVKAPIVNQTIKVEIYNNAAPAGPGSVNYFPIVRAPSGSSGPFMIAVGIVTDHR